MQKHQEVSTKTRHLRQLLRIAMGAEELGRLIRQAREDADLTQPQLAEKIGLSHPQSISKYERGLTEVPAKRLRRIAEITGKPVSFFLGVDPTTREGQDGSAISTAAAMADLDARLAKLEARVADGFEKNVALLGSLAAAIDRLEQREPHQSARAT
jgi:transcriptional regulator with XRE-family HTH domain